MTATPNESVSIFTLPVDEACEALRDMRPLVTGTYARRVHELLQQPAASVLPRYVLDETGHHVTAREESAGYSAAELAQGAAYRMAARVFERAAAELLLCLRRPFAYKLASVAQVTRPEPPEFAVGAITRLADAVALYLIPALQSHQPTNKVEAEALCNEAHIRVNSFLLLCEGAALLLSNSARYPRHIRLMAAVWALFLFNWLVRWCAGVTDGPRHEAGCADIPSSEAGKQPVGHWLEDIESNMDAVLDAVVADLAWHLERDPIAAQTPRAETRAVRAAV